MLRRCTRYCPRKDKEREVGFCVQVRLSSLCRSRKHIGQICISEKVITSYAATRCCKTERTETLACATVRIVLLYSVWSPGSLQHRPTDAVNSGLRVTILLLIKFLVNKTNRRTNFSKLIFVKKRYMFRAVPLPIIRSSPLYIRHWYMSCKSDDSFQARSG